MRYRAALCIAHEEHRVILVVPAHADPVTGKRLGGRDRLGRPLRSRPLPRAATLPDGANRRQAARAIGRERNRKGELALTLVRVRDGVASERDREQSGAAGIRPLDGIWAAAHRHHRPRHELEGRLEDHLPVDVARSSAPSRDQ